MHRPTDESQRAWQHVDGQQRESPSGQSARVAVPGTHEREVAGETHPYSQGGRAGDFDGPLLGALEVAFHEFFNETLEGVVGEVVEGVDGGVVEEFVEGVVEKGRVAQQT